MNVSVPVFRADSLEVRPPGAADPLMDDVTFTISAGQLVCVAGRSGTGKSTLLLLAAGLNRPQRGRVIWDGQNIEFWRDDRRQKWRANHIGYMDQDTSMIEELTIGQNIMLPRPGHRHVDLVSSASALCERLGIFGITGRLPHRVSGGERQRAALARALVTRPRLVILDEPTANLDAASALRVLDLLADECGRGAAILAASHDPLLKEAADLMWDLDNYAQAVATRQQ